MNEGENRLFDVNASGYLRIDQELRERYLTPETDTAYVQAIGTDLQVMIPSEREQLLIRLPLQEWDASVLKKRRLDRNGIYIERWAKNLKASVERGNGQAVLGRVQRTEVENDLL